MDNETAVAALSALAQGTRLDAFRLLVRHEPEGIPAGEVARLLDVPQNTMSAHLAVLTRAGLLISQRRSRSIVYRVDFARFRLLVLFLIRDCCGDRTDLHEALLEELLPSCLRETGVIQRDRQ